MIRRLAVMAMVVLFSGMAGCDEINEIVTGTKTYRQYKIDGRWAGTMRVEGSADDIPIIFTIDHNNDDDTRVPFKLSNVNFTGNAGETSCSGAWDPPTIKFVCGGTAGYTFNGTVNEGLNAMTGTWLTDGYSGTWSANKTLSY